MCVCVCVSVCLLARVSTACDLTAGGDLVVVGIRPGTLSQPGPWGSQRIKDLMVYVGSGSRPNHSVHTPFGWLHENTANSIVAVSVSTDHA